LSNPIKILKKIITTKWRTWAARTQLEFTVHDHKVTRSMEHYFTAHEPVITSSRVEWNTAYISFGIYISSYCLLCQRQPITYVAKQ